MEEPSMPFGHFSTSHFVEVQDLLGVTSLVELNFETS